MVKSGNQMFDVVLFNSDELVQNVSDYQECLTTIFNHSPQLSKMIIDETILKGKGLVEVSTLEEAMKQRNELLLFGLRSQIYPTVKSSSYINRK
jgi:ATP-dependent Clp protease adapter protein ClpS